MTRSMANHEMAELHGISTTLTSINVADVNVNHPVL